MSVILYGNKEAVIKAKNRFITNSKDFFITYRTAVTFLIIAAFLDAFSTFCFMYVLGVEMEMHPMIRSVSEFAGPFMGPFIGGAIKVSLGFCALIYVRKFEKLIMVMAGLFYCYAFMHNLSVSGVFSIL